MRLRGSNWRGAHVLQQIGTAWSKIISYYEVDYGDVTKNSYM